MAEEAFLSLLLKLHVKESRYLGTDFEVTFLLFPFFHGSEIPRKPTQIQRTFNSVDSEVDPGFYHLGSTSIQKKNENSIVQLFKMLDGMAQIRVSTAARKQEYKENIHFY